MAKLTYLSSAELRKMSAKDLNTEIAVVRHSYSTKNLQVRTGKDKEVHVLKLMRAYIARIQTILTEQRVQAIIDSNKPTE